MLLKPYLQRMVREKAFQEEVLALLKKGATDLVEADTRKRGYILTFMW